MEEKNKKKVILMIVGVIVLMLVVVGATFAYFNAQVGIGDKTTLNLQAGTTDSLSFNINDIDVTDSSNKVDDENDKDDIIINAGQSNFGQNGYSLGDGVKLNAHLIAGDDDSTASFTYNVYLDVSRNNLEYTSYQKDGKVISFKTSEEKENAYYDGMEDGSYLDEYDPIPELVLVVQKPDGKYLDEIEGLNKSEIMIGEERVPCFDITEAQELITIASEYPIDATRENNGEEDQNWQVRVIFKNLETDQHLNTDKSFTAKISIQSEKINYLDIGGGEEYAYYRNSEYTSYIKNVYFVDYIAERDDPDVITGWDLSTEKDGSIMGWLKEETGSEEETYSISEEPAYNLYIGSNEKIMVRDFSYAFYRLESVETIDLNLDILDTSNMISTRDTFAFSPFRLMSLDTISLEENEGTKIIGIEDLDVSNVTNMKEMFFGARRINTLDLSKWKTQNVTDMSNMFENTYVLTELDLSGWDTHNVTDMSHMFERASNLTTLKVNNWDLSGTKLYNGSESEGPFYGMFANTNLQIIEGIETWNVSEVTDMSFMFYRASSLTSLDLSNWDVHNVTDMSYMFSNAMSLTTLKVNNWNLSGTKFYEYCDDYYCNGPFYGMFAYIDSLTKIEGIETWNVSEVIDMSGMFLTSSVTTLDLSGWETHNVTNMSYMFANTYGLTSIDMRKATFSQVTSYDYMFGDINSALQVTVTGDANKKWFIDNRILTEEHLEVLSE